MRVALSVVAVVALGIGFTSLAAEPDAPGKSTKEDLDCAMYTKPYKGTEHGAYMLPAGLEWRVMPKYVGVDKDGKRMVDDRITMVLVDGENRFWPFIAKMSVEQAEVLKEQLGEVIAEKQERGG